MLTHTSGSVVGLGGWLAAAVSWFIIYWSGLAEPALSVLEQWPAQDTMGGCFKFMSATFCQWTRWPFFFSLLNLSKAAEDDCCMYMYTYQSLSPVSESIVCMLNNCFQRFPGYTLWLHFPRLHARKFIHWIGNTAIINTGNLGAFWLRQKNAFCTQCGVEDLCLHSLVYSTRALAKNCVIPLNIVVSKSRSEDADSSRNIKLVHVHVLASGCCCLGYMNGKFFLCKYETILNPNFLSAQNFHIICEHTFVCTHFLSNKYIIKHLNVFIILQQW